MIATSTRGQLRFSHRNKNGDRGGCDKPLLKKETKAAAAKVSGWMERSKYSVKLCKCCVLTACVCYVQIRPTKNQCQRSRGASLLCVWTEPCLTCLMGCTAALPLSRCCMEEAARGTAPTAGLTRHCRLLTQAHEDTVSRVKAPTRSLWNSLILISGLFMT